MQSKDFKLDPLLTPPSSLLKSPPCSSDLLAAGQGLSHQFFGCKEVYGMTFLQAPFLEDHRWHCGTFKHVKIAMDVAPPL